MERDAAESPGESFEGGPPGRASPVPERQQGDVEPATLEAGPREVFTVGVGVADVDQGATADVNHMGEILARLHLNNRREAVRYWKDSQLK